MTDLHMTTASSQSSSVTVRVALAGLTKLQSDAVRMTLLLTYGHRQLSLAPDGSHLTVELPTGQRTVDVPELASDTTGMYSS